MKRIELDNYDANVTCPYCNEQGAVAWWPGRWNVGDVLYVYQFCEACRQSWKETWQLAKVEIGETESESKAAALGTD